jgi:hypothetical protein
VYAEQQVAELDDARSKLAVKVVSMEVVKDAMAFLNKKRKRKTKWGGRPEVYEVSCNGIRNKCCQGCNVDRGQSDEGVCHAVDDQLRCKIHPET